MAVYGRKISDFSGSISKGSAEDFDHSCEPCLAIGKQIEAHGFCVDCEEYMCTNCSGYHHRMKATKSHQFLDKENMNKHTVQKKYSSICTEKCPLHTNEFIKFFCTNHEILGCTDCITLTHRTCEVDYIPEKCEGIEDSKEYKDTVKKLDEKVRELDKVMKKANVDNSQIDISHENTLKEIFKFRREINNHLDQLQAKIQADLAKKKSDDKGKVKGVLEDCASISTDLNKMLSDLQCSGTSQKPGQIYINMKQAQLKLNSDEVKKCERMLVQINTNYKFECNKELESILSNQSAFGKLSASPEIISPIKKAIENFICKEDINLRTKSDKEKCYITGCAVLGYNKLGLLDRNNYKLKIVDTQRRTVVDEMFLGSGPWDIAALEEDEIAVTMPLNREIMILATAGKLSIIRKIPLKVEYKGITCHQDKLFAVCWRPHHVLIVDKYGNNQRSISLNMKSFISPSYILFNEDFKLIYISDTSDESVVGLTLEGEITSEYGHLSAPMGMAMLTDGSLLVCSRRNGIVHHFSGDLQQGQAVIDNLQQPISICYDASQSELYIGSVSDKLKVFSAN